MTTGERDRMSVAKKTDLDFDEAAQAVNMRQRAVHGRGGALGRHRGAGGGRRAEAIAAFEIAPSMRDKFGGGSCAR